MANDRQVVALLEDLGRCWVEGLAGMYAHIVDGLPEAEEFPNAPA